MKTLLFLLLFQGLDTLQLHTIFHEPYLSGVRPEFISFSPDQERIYFTWNDSSKTERHTYSVSPEGRHLNYHDDAPEARAVVSPDQRHWAYLKNENLWINGPDYSNPQLLLETEHTISNIHWLDDNRTIVFMMDSNVWIFRRDPGMLRQWTYLDYSERENIRINLLSVSGDGRYFVLQETDSSDFLEILFPEYVNTFVREGMSRRGQANTAVFIYDNKTRQMYPLFDGEWAVSSHAVSSSGKYLAIDRIDHSMKRREILRYNLSSAALNSEQPGADDSIKSQTDIVITADTLFTKTTDGWVYPNLHTLTFASDSDHLMFTSEADGWNHIYTVDPDDTEPRQRTSGSFEVPWADWESDRFILFASTEADPGERRIYRLDLRNDSIREITSKSAWREAFSLNRNKDQLIYEKSYWNRPADLYVMNIAARRPTETRITNSVPDRFYDIDWQQPEYVRFKARDNVTSLSMTILHPEDFDPEKTWPAIVFVHGAGSLQNVYKGWSSFYPREYMFHQYLTRQGYVVLEVDYRHSTGYGRKFREDVTNWMGRYELFDILDGLDYVDASGGYIDRSRVGIYGGSYGGFMALYAVSMEPETFQAGAALRAVTNWENYYYANPWYTRARLGTPDEHPEHYKRSSPISYADSLRRPVKLFHGLMDDNVGFQDAMQYVDRLVKSGNTDFELMVYPTERHSFISPEAWYDQYYRIFHFFEKHLK